MLPGHGRMKTAQHSPSRRPWWTSSTRTCRRWVAAAGYIIAVPAAAPDRQGAALGAPTSRGSAPFGAKTAGPQAGSRQRHEAAYARPNLSDGFSATLPPCPRSRAPISRPPDPRRSATSQPISRAPRTEPQLLPEPPTIHHHPDQERVAQGIVGAGFSNPSIDTSIAPATTRQRRADATKICKCRPHTSSAHGGGCHFIVADRAHHPPPGRFSAPVRKARSPGPARSRTAPYNSLTAMVEPVTGSNPQSPRGARRPHRAACPPHRAQARGGQVADHS